MPIDGDVVTDHLRRANLGDSKVAEYHQECLLCRRAIHRGDVIKAGARNVFSDALLWLHERCADFVLTMYGPNVSLLDNGWRQMQWNQRCYVCRVVVKVGNIAYRVPHWKDPADPLTLCLEWACPNCQRSDAAPRLS